MSAAQNHPYVRTLQEQLIEAAAVALHQPCLARWAGEEFWVRDHWSTKHDVDAHRDAAECVVVAQWPLVVAALDERRPPETEPFHVVEFRKDGWTIKHPLACRPHLFECLVNRAAERDLTKPPDELGRFRMELLDSGELQVLDRLA